MSGAVDAGPHASNPDSSPSTRTTARSRPLTPGPSEGSAGSSRGRPAVAWKGAERAGEGGMTGKRLVPGRPEAQALGQLVDEQRVGTVASQLQRADGVGCPDDAVGSAGGEPGQQARPPLLQERSPGHLVGVAAQIGDPVAEQSFVTEVLAPVFVLDTADWFRGRSEPGAIRVHPARYDLHGPDPHQRLGGHRAVVGEEPVELGSGSAKPIQGVQQDVVAGHPLSVRGAAEDK
jgi:hypothetical protein